MKKKTIIIIIKGYKENTSKKKNRIRTHLVTVPEGLSAETTNPNRRSLEGRRPGDGGLILGQHFREDAAGAAIQHPRALPGACGTLYVTSLHQNQV